ncbi:hypothetical protein CVT24_008447 [Panaeolus cyanescens]|uniref:SH3 domain-containing protein n=1 Tax=Panaeolus cyanescens TaxID=181874 RepID=A0A409VDZ0_9AGAR|nr:hypothetical protein CVT24_008447 [Panaeolus cyanescens]
MAARAQQLSATSLARYASARQPDVDVFNGSQSRAYCNSFWGTGDSGPNIMFARMRGASKTTDELRNFWNERCVIEEEYAARLAKLAKAPIGADEIGELRNSLDTLRIETEKQSESHLELANQIRLDLEGPTAQFHQKQIVHRRSIQVPLERKFKEKQTQESYVKKSREKYEADCLRVQSYTQQASYMTGTDLAKVQLKLQRTRQTMQGNERDYEKFSKDLADFLPGWEREWKDYCDSCQDLEEERLDFMKDIIWAYANDISTICVTDDQSCERIRTALDNLEPERDVENFVNEFGTGNLISVPAEFIATSSVGEPQLPPPPLIRYADYQRTSRRAVPAYHHEHAVLGGPGHNQGHQNDSPHDSVNGADSGSYHDAPNGSGHSVRNQTAPPQTNPPNHPPPPIPEPAPPMSHQVSTSTIGTASSSRSPSPNRQYRQSQPLPMVPGGANNGPSHARAPTPPPPIPQQPSNRILFYVKALYDYTATIDEEFDFQAGDVIAVTATPDDGWWSGELLDEARREEGRNVFPSNFVCLF